MVTNYQNVKNWRTKNPDKLREQRRKYREKHRIEVQRKWREWYHKKQEERNKEVVD